jgi:hypothetical protein
MPMEAGHTSAPQARDLIRADQAHNLLLCNGATYRQIAAILNDESRSAQEAAAEALRKLEFRKEIHRRN